MAIQTFVKNATTLGATGWSAAGIADDATLIIGTGSSTIDTALDQSATTTAGIDYLHILRGFTGHLGSPSDPAILEFQTAHTADINFVYKAGGGSASLDVAAITCTSVECDANGTLNLVGSGTITNLYVRSGTVIISGGVTVTNIYVFGGVVTLRDGAGTAPTLIECNAGSIVSYRAPTTITMQGTNASAMVEKPGGSITTANVTVGRLTLLASDIATINGGHLGILDVGNVIEDVAVGATANNREGGFQIVGRDNPQVTYTDDSLPVGGGDSGGGPGL